MEDKKLPPGGEEAAPTETPIRTCAAPCCLSTATPSKRCPRCKEQGVVDGSFFCDADCFRAAWPEHKRRHVKKSNSACPNVAARAAQADPRVAAAFAGIVAALAESGVALEGDGLGWRRRDMFDKGRRLVATKAFRPGDVIFEDPYCRSFRTASPIPKRADFLKCHILDIFNITEHGQFEFFAAKVSYLWPAFALRWTTEQEEAALDTALAAASSYESLAQEAIAANVSAVAPVATEVFNSAYFRKQGRDLLRTLKNDDLRGCLEERIALLRRLWGLPLPAASDKEKEDALVLARFCQVLHFNSLPLKEPRNQQSTHEIVSVHLAVGINHSCWPNANLRFNVDEGARLVEGMNDSGSLVLYAIADIQVGEEVTVSHIEDSYKPLSDLHQALRTRHGASVGTAPGAAATFKAPQLSTTSATRNWDRHKQTWSRGWRACRRCYKPRRH